MHPLKVTCTRLDISFVVNYLSHSQEASQMLHWKLLRRVLQYLQDSKSRDICYNQHKSQVTLDAFADADFAVGPDRRSTTRCIVCIYGSPVLWVSHVQKTIAKSTTKAELIALCANAHDMKFLYSVKHEILLDFPLPIMLNEDNVGTIRRTQLYVSRGCIHHLDLRFYKAQDYMK